MAGTRIQLGLMIGRLVPTRAPAAVLHAVESVSVEQSAEGRGGFQIQLRAERGTKLMPDYALLQDKQIGIGYRVIITVSVNASQHVLMDGIITHLQLMPASPQQGAMLTVTGEDISAMMDIVEISLAYPQMGAAAVIGLVLGKYAAIGVMPVIVPPFSMETSVTPQRQTDRAYLETLAAEYDNVFYVHPGPVAGTNIAYWGPHFGTRIASLIQKAAPLSAIGGPGSNIESMQFSNDGTKPTRVFGLVSDSKANVPIPVLGVADVHLPPMAAESPLIKNLPYVRNSLTKYRGGNAAKANWLAQQQVNRSTESAVTANGSLETRRYGDVLRSPGRVVVRGAGQSYNGEYFIQQVQHEITRDVYRQSFSLSREGTGSLKAGAF